MEGGRAIGEEGRTQREEKGGSQRERAVSTLEPAIAYHQQWETSGGSSSGTGRSDLWPPTHGSGKVITI